MSIFSDLEYPIAFLYLIQSYEWQFRIFVIIWELKVWWALLVASWMVNFKLQLQKFPIICGSILGKKSQGDFVTFFLCWILLAHIWQ